MDQEVLDARAKLAARFGKTQVGGKGKFHLSYRLLDMNLDCHWLIQYHLRIYLTDIGLFNFRNPKKN